MKFLKNYSVLALSLAMATAVSCSKDDAGVNDTQTTSPEVAQSSSEIIPDQYIVVYKESGKSSGDYRLNKQAVQQKTIAVIAETAIQGAEVLDVYSAALSGAVVKMSKDQAAILRNSPDVAYIEQDRIVSLGKPSWAGGNDGGSTGEEKPYGITNVNGGLAPYTGTGVVWVIDSGVDLDHPDLNVDVSRSVTVFTSGKDAKSADDGNGHGSHVAGTIAAIDNDFGVIGVAPGATVVGVKVLDSRGSGSYSGVIAGVDYVAANGSSGDVANMSLGGPVSQALDDAVIAAASNGIKFALAAGNDAADASTYSPARANHANIYTISAVDNNYRFASFSNYGNPPVDYAAPGVNVKSTWKDGGYNTISGTSMASPHAAGVLLLGAPQTGPAIKGDPDGDVDPFITN